MANVLDDIATRFMAFSDALEASFGDLSIDFSLPSKTAGSSRAAAGKGGAAGMPAAGDAGALAAAAAERAAAKQRGEEILAQLPPGYFDTAFDPLEHELRCMAADARQGDIDNVVDRLTAAMEVRTTAQTSAPCARDRLARTHARTRYVLHVSLRAVPRACVPGGGGAAGQARTAQPGQADRGHHQRDAGGGRPQGAGAGVCVHTCNTLILMRLQSVGHARC